MEAEPPAVLCCVPLGICLSSLLLPECLKYLSSLKVSQDGQSREDRHIPSYNHYPQEECREGKSHGPKTYSVSPTLPSTASLGATVGSQITGSF